MRWIISAINIDLILLSRGELLDRDGEVLISSNQGFKEESIRISNPYS